MNILLNVCVFILFTHFICLLTGFVIGAFLVTMMNNQPDPKS